MQRHIIKNYQFIVLQTSANKRMYQTVKNTSLSQQVRLLYDTSASPLAHKSHSLI